MLMRADLPCERRRSRRRSSRRPTWPSTTGRVRPRCGARNHLLPAARAQRGGRAVFHPAADVREDHAIGRPVPEIYAERLRDEGVDAEEIDATAGVGARKLEEAVEQPVQPPRIERLSAANGSRSSANSAPLTGGRPASRRNSCGNRREQLMHIPADFTRIPRSCASCKRRREAMQAGEGIDWGTPRPWPSPRCWPKGMPVRFSGQDSRRGTFSHRHAVLYRLSRPGAPTARCRRAGAERARPSQIYDSMLSEVGGARL